MASFVDTALPRSTCFAVTTPETGAEMRLKASRAPHSSTSALAISNAERAASRSASVTSPPACRR
jgi:hypothetical protein